MEKVRCHLLLLIFIDVSFVISAAKVPLTVECPPFENEENALDALRQSSLNQFFNIKESTTPYCNCQMHILRSGRTAIVKCDFQSKEAIVLTDKVFSFKKWNSTSVYVRMKNCLNANVSSSFLSAWMDSPSSAMDIWHCGKVFIDETLKPRPDQAFPRLKSFLGVGIVDVEIASVPKYFLRDRSRAALRIKDCNITTLHHGIFHNIEEVRYLVIENSTVDLVEGPMSSTGVTSLSRKTMHSWDGFEMLNCTIGKIGAHSFAFTHKSDTEDYFVQNNVIGEIEMGGFSVIGDIRVKITDNIFESIGPLALQVSVTGPFYFTDNVIQKFEDRSLKGMKCTGSLVSLENNTFYVNTPRESGATLLFTDECRPNKAKYVVRSTKEKQTQTRGNEHLGVPIAIILFVVIIAGVIFWLWRKGTFRIYMYRRQDTPLCRDNPDIILP